MNLASYPQAGIKVRKSLDRSTAAIQFSEDRVPSRAEKDLLECVGDPGVRPFGFNMARRQWERTDTEQPGANLIDAKRIAGELAAARQEGRGR